MIPNSLQDAHLGDGATDRLALPSGNECSAVTGALVMAPHLASMLRRPDPLPSAIALPSSCIWGITGEPGSSQPPHSRSCRLCLCGSPGEELLLHLHRGTSSKAETAAGLPLSANHRGSTVGKIVRAGDLAGILSFAHLKSSQGQRHHMVDGAPPCVQRLWHANAFW